MTRPKTSELTREQFKALCPHHHLLTRGYCPKAHIRCDLDFPKPCPRMFRYDLKYGDYQRKRPRGYNIPKWNRHNHPDLFPDEAKKHKKDENK